MFHKIVFFILFTGFVLSGCSTVPEQADTSGNLSEFDDFYDGESDLLYKNRESPDTANGLIALGDSALAQSRLDEALYQYVKAANLDNRSDTAVFRIASVHAMKGNTEKAIRAYNMVLDINPDHAGAHEGLGQLLLGQRRYDEAREHLTKAATGGGIDSWRLYNSLGVIADLKKEYKQATEHYEKALAIQPEHPLILNNMGYSHYLLGNWEDAGKYYKKAVLIDKKFERAWRNLGLLYVRKGNYEEATNAFTQIESLPEAYNDIGFICMLNEKYDIAEAFFKRAIKLSPRYYEAANDNLKRNKMLSKGQ